MKLHLSAILLFTTAACTTPAPLAPVATPVAAVAPAPVADSASEDRRLMAFLDAAFDAQAARFPQFLTSLGSKEQYDRLNNHTDAYQQESLAQSEAQLRDLRAQFDLFTGEAIECDDLIGALRGAK